jgi:hypothetical protein
MHLGHYGVMIVGSGLILAFGIVEAFVNNPLPTVMPRRLKYLAPGYVATRCVTKAV